MSVGGCMRFIFLAVFLCVASNGYALTMGQAIDKAGQQRMLSQRIAQSFILTGIQPDNARYKAQLDKAIKQFQENLDTLQANNDAISMRGDLLTVRNLWKPFKTVATGPVTKQNAAELSEKSDALLTAAHTYVQKLEALSNHKGAELVNVSGRQRMLSQRIAKNYLAYYWGLESEASLEKLYADLAEYELMLTFLKDSQFNTETIKKKILKTEGHLKYASKGFDGDMSLKGDRLIFVITGTTDTMLHNMNEITHLYASELENTEQVAAF